MGSRKDLVSAKSTGKSLEVFKLRDGMNRSDQICIFKKIVWLEGREGFQRVAVDVQRPVRRLGQCPGD